MRKVIVPPSRSKGRYNNKSKSKCCSRTVELLNNSINRPIIIHAAFLAFFFLIILIVFELFDNETLTSITSFFRNIKTPTYSVFSTPIDNNYISIKDSLDKLSDILPPTKNEKLTLDCNDATWCTIGMPKVSYFGFAPPNNIAKWKKARSQAMR